MTPPDMPAQWCAACAEREKLAEIVRSRPIHLKMVDIYRGQAGYRTPGQIADAAWYTGQPSPGHTIPALAAFRRHKGGE